MKRRTLLKGAAATTVLVTAAASGLLVPIKVLASDWPETAFESDTTADAIKQYFGDATVNDSDQVAIKAPLQAENGAVVPIKVTTTLANVESIAILVEKNPMPFVASLDVLSGSSGALFSTRVKMGQTSPVICLVKAGGRVHRASQVVKVTVGGCGG
ncbi:MAG: thiosulfate oxidation carrier protein SoxY [Pseudomonadota bacterium]|nr:thiosulfate oxidation carrier protein SoxY [Pseudomonadota bacterium]